MRRTRRSSKKSWTSPAACSGVLWTTSRQRGRSASNAAIGRDLTPHRSSTTGSSNGGWSSCYRRACCRTSISITGCPFTRWARSRRNARRSSAIDRRQVTRAVSMRCAIRCRAGRPSPKAMSRRTESSRPAASTRRPTGRWVISTISRSWRHGTLRRSSGCAKRTCAATSAALCASGALHIPERLQRFLRTQAVHVGNPDGAPIHLDQRVGGEVVQDPRKVLLRKIESRRNDSLLGREQYIDRAAVYALGQPSQKITYDPLPSGQQRAALEVQGALVELAAQLPNDPACKLRIPADLEQNHFFRDVQQRAVRDGFRRREVTAPEEQGGFAEAFPVADQLQDSLLTSARLQRKLHLTLE